MIPALQKDETLLADIHGAVPDPASLHVWWLGQSGFLLKHAGDFLLLDPYLSDALTLKYAATDKPHVRMTERCIRPEQLGFVKKVTSSHQHTDHFDEATLRPLSEVACGIQCVLPLATIAAAEHRLPGAQIDWVGLDDGTQVQLGQWHITGVAAAHNSIDRDSAGHCKFLGFIIQVGAFRLYHSGDTLLHPGLEPALRQGPLDLAMVPINGNDPSRRVAGNLNGAEAAGLAKAAGARLAVPHHFEGFEFNTASPDLFVNTCKQLGQDHRVMRCGERITMQA
jgi:L-ascorbate metabolism protein UlaG (beta-lactamase superfamily)